MPAWARERRLHTYEPRSTSKRLQQHGGEGYNMSLGSVCKCLREQRRERYKPSKRGGKATYELTDLRG